MPAAALMEYLIERKARIEHALEERLPSEMTEPRNVHAAMRYAALNGGKRLRPILALSVADLGGLAPSQVMDAAIAVEFVHTASLILDDLPAMDNSDFRRDKPATHRAYDEATAILASLALLAEAYALVARNAAALLPPDGVAGVVQIFSDTIGTAGLIQGQHIDLTLARAEHTLERLEEIYRRKAAVLFHAAIAIPAKLAKLDESKCAALKTFAMNLGIAFQVTDDIIDAHHLHSDGEQKVTYSTLLGETRAREAVNELVAAATAALSPFGKNAEPLRLMAAYVATRSS